MSILFFIVIVFLPWLLFLIGVALSKIVGSMMALHILFHVLGFVEWLVFTYGFLKEELEKLQIKKLFVILYVITYLAYFLFLFPYDFSQVSSVIKPFWQLPLISLLLNGIYFILSKVKSKDKAQIIFIAYPLIEFIPSFAIIVVFSGLSALTS